MGNILLDGTIVPNGNIDFVPTNGSAKSSKLTVSGMIDTPTATLDITANGNNIDVTNYAKANVAVPTSSGGITPSGTKQITENGTYDVTNFASAEVNVPTGGGTATDDMYAAGNCPIGQIVTVTFPQTIDQRRPFSIVGAHSAGVFTNNNLNKISFMALNPYGFLMVMKKLETDTQGTTYANKDYSAFVTIDGATVTINRYSGLSNAPGDWHFKCVYLDTP